MQIIVMKVVCFSVNSIEINILDKFAFTRENNVERLNSRLKWFDKFARYTEHRVFCRTTFIDSKTSGNRAE